MDLAEKQGVLIADFSIIEDLTERFSAIVDQSRRAKPLPDDARIDANLVPGCTSQVWLTGWLENGACQFRTDADAPTVKGVAVLLSDLYSDAPPAEVIAIEPECVQALGIDRILTPTRLNGLGQIRKRIREIAESLSPKP